MPRSGSSIQARGVVDRDWFGNEARPFVGEMLQQPGFVREEQRQRVVAHRPDRARMGNRLEVDVPLRSGTPQYVRQTPRPHLSRYAGPRYPEVVVDPGQRFGVPAGPGPGRRDPGVRRQCQMVARGKDQWVVEIRHPARVLGRLAGIHHQIAGRFVEAGQHVRLDAVLVPQRLDRRRRHPETRTPPQRRPAVGRKAGRESLDPAGGSLRQSRSHQDTMRSDPTPHLN